MSNDYFSDLSPMLHASQKTQSSSKEQLSVADLPKRLKEAINVGAANGKKITNADVEKAMNEPSGRNAVIGLVQRSPIGFTRPTFEELSRNGYVVSMNGDAFSGPGGSGTVNKTQDGLEQFTYKTDKVEQSMIYDANGNAQKGTIIIRDDIGGIERQLDFIINEDGKMTVVQ